MKKPFSFVEALRGVNPSPTEIQVEMLRVIDVKSEQVMNLSDEVTSRLDDLVLSKKFGGPGLSSISALKDSTELLFQEAKMLAQMKVLFREVFKEDMGKIDRLHAEWAAKSCKDFLKSKKSGL